MIEQQLFSELDFTKENCMKHYKIKVACIHCVWTFACAIHWNSPAGSVCDLYSLTSGIYFYQLNAHTLTKWQKSFVQQYKFKQIKENVKIESQQIYGTFQINVIVEQHIKNGQFELLLNKQMLCLSKCWDCSQLTWNWPTVQDIELCYSNSSVQKIPNSKIWQNWSTATATATTKQ